MRLVGLLLAAGCTGNGVTLLGDRPADVQTAATPGAIASAGSVTPEDPRFDPANWPTVVGGDRPTPVLFPSTWDGQAMPLVLVLHGYGVDGALQDLYFGTSTYIEDRQFVEVHPDGLRNSLGMRYWNATPACCDLEHSGVDDEGYLLGLIDEIEAAMPIDRVVVLGHSNGGFMTWRLACHAADRLTAVASLAGSTYLDPAECQPEAAIDALEMHGTADPIIPYGGTDAFPGAEETVDRWAQLTGCPSLPESIGTADHDSLVVGEETDAQSWTQDSCGVDVELWKMTGSGHVPVPTDAFRDDLIGWMLRDVH